MARYKPQDRNSLLQPVVLSEQIVPGSFAFALDYLVGNELDLTAMDAKFKNDEIGASAYDPRVMLKIVLLAYSQGLISSRVIEQTCQRNVQFIAIDGVKLPSNASKERSGTHEELRHRANRLDQAADKILALHQAQDKQGLEEALEPKRQARIDALRNESKRTRAFLATPQGVLTAKVKNSNPTSPTPRAPRWPPAKA